MNSPAFRQPYTELGEGFFQYCNPTPVAAPELIAWNKALAAELGLSGMEAQDKEIAEFFSGNITHNSAQPLAMAYAGHQFGQFNPYLGDGRALYLGALKHTDGNLREIQLKGSGRTPFSRRGDGRSALGPVLREYLLSEAMHKLGVPTTRALAAVLSGEQVFRETMKPGGIFTRVSSSYIRVGTFQYFAMQQDTESLKTLCTYVIKQNYPELKTTDNPYLALFKAVALRQAVLIAQWMQLGFIHGVMNTDNMSIAGETIDYGPCAFMDHFQHNKVFSSIDHQGRYAYGNQPSIGLWNLSRLAECLLPLFDDDRDRAIQLAQDILDEYMTTYHRSWLNGFLNKCGLTVIDESNEENDTMFIESLLRLMQKHHADFTLTFYHLSQQNNQASNLDEDYIALIGGQEEARQWLLQWRQRLGDETASEDERKVFMRQINPVYIPRNHQIETAIRAAEDDHNFQPFHSLHQVLQNPYQYQLGQDDYMRPPEPDEVVYQTFCGT